MKLAWSSSSSLWIANVRKTWPGWGNSLLAFLALAMAPIPICSKPGGRGCGQSGLLTCNLKGSNPVNIYVNIIYSKYKGPQGDQRRT